MPSSPSARGKSRLAAISGNSGSASATSWLCALFGASSCWPASAAVRPTAPPAWVREDSTPPVVLRAFFSGWVFMLSFPSSVVLLLGMVQLGGNLRNWITEWAFASRAYGGHAKPVAHSGNHRVHLHARGAAGR